MNENAVVIRKAVEADSEKIWVLMRDLAVFEQYIDVFAVTPEMYEKAASEKSRLIFIVF